MQEKLPKMNTQRFPFQNKTAHVYYAHNVNMSGNRNDFIYDKTNLLQVLEAVSITLMK